MRRGVHVVLAVFFLAGPLRAGSLSHRERERLAAEGQTLFEQRRPTEAREKWEQALSGGATRAEIRRWRPWIGRTFEAEGNFQKALTAYQEAFDVDAKSVDRMVDLARVYDTVELDERALDLYERALKRDHARRDVLVALADLHFGAGRGTDARRFAVDALRRESRDPVAMMLLARIEESEGNLAGAARRREGVLEVRPSGADALTLGRLWARAGELELADTAYRRAAELGVDSADLFFERGAVAWRQGDADAAERRLGEALAKDPRFAPASFLLSVVDWERGRSARAAERLRGISIPADTVLAPLRDHFLTALTFGSGAGGKK